MHPAVEKVVCLDPTVAWVVCVDRLEILLGPVAQLHSPDIFEEAFHLVDLHYTILRLRDISRPFWGQTTVVAILTSLVALKTLEMYPMFGQILFALFAPVVDHILHSFIHLLSKVCTLGFVRVLWVKSIARLILRFVEVHGHLVPNDPALEKIVGAYTLIVCIESVHAFPVLFCPIVWHISPHSGEEFGGPFLRQECGLIIITSFDQGLRSPLVKVVLIFLISMEFAQVPPVIPLWGFDLVDPMLSNIAYNFLL